VIEAIWAAVAVYRWRFGQTLFRVGCLAHSLREPFTVPVRGDRIRLNKGTKI
jgi:hypothetical protein